jgi:hypothetical protein
MSEGKMNLHQFADRHGLQATNFGIAGPRGHIHQGRAGWVYFQYGTRACKFNPVTQAKQAIVSIGLQYTPPPEPIKKDRGAFLIVKRTDGWYVADKAGPFKTREAARTARESLKIHQQETPKKIS